MSSKKFSLANRVKSFKYALDGLRALFKEEHNARIHLVITVLVIIAGIFFQISLAEWIAVILTIGFVFVTEILNTAIEDIADFISPERDTRIKRMKDLGAAAVLLSAITAVVIGILIFLPKLWELLFQMKGS